MEFITTVIAHLATLVAMGAMFYLIIIFVLKADDDIETIMRVLAAAGGLLLFLGGKTTGVSIPALMLSSIDSSGGMVAALIQYIFPAIAGSLITYLLFRSIRNSSRDDNKRVYFLIFISTLITLLFTDVYFGNVVSDSENSSISTNISFLSGIILTLLFKVDIVVSLYQIIRGNKSETIDHDDESQKNSWKDKY